MLAYITLSGNYTLNNIGSLKKTLRDYYHAETYLVYV